MKYNFSQGMLTFITGGQLSLFLTATSWISIEYIIESIVHI